MIKKSYQLLKLLLLIITLTRAAELHAQQLVVTGNVIDDTSQGLPGVAITVKGTNISTSTDAKGNFRIEVPNPNSVLVVSFIGLKTQEINVNNRTNINISLNPDDIAMQEVVVVGYGTQKKVNLTGALDVVSGERLAERPIMNAGEGLQGLSPNLNVTVNSGDPAGGVDFNIRGFESINGGSPLILVDNIPMDLNKINPEDIKSLTVLKDGAAAAVYGARAAFGVILVETKSGSQGMRVNLSSQLSWNKPIWHVDPIDNGYVYALERNRIDERDGRTPTYDATYLDGLQKYWEDPANNPSWALINGTFQNYGYENLSNTLMSSFSPRQKYDLSISGASDKATYYTSFGLFNNDGWINHAGNDNFKRYNILAKGDYKIKSWLSFEQQVRVDMQRSDKPAAADINTVIRNEPTRSHVIPLIPGFEQYEGQYWNHGLMILPNLENGGRETFSNSDIWLKSGVTVKPLKRMTIRSDFSYNIFNRQLQDARPQFEVISQTITQDNPVEKFGDDEISVNRQFNQYYVFNAYGEYEVNDIKNHYIKGMLGYNQEWDYNTTVSGSATTLLSPNIPDISAVTGVQQIGGGKGHASLRGAFYRLNYIFKDRYLFETSGRYDGTSRFPKKDRFGFFPSASAGWRISEEPFMAFSKKVLNNMKIRASYGSLGNQLLGNNNLYPYIPSMGSGFSNFVMGSGQTPFVRMPGLVSPTLTWEQVVSKNLGLDLAFLNNKLEATFDIYTRDTKDMLMRMDYPDVLGTTAPQENAADLRTKGWEVTLGWRDNPSKQFSYRVNLNLADNSSQITKYDNPTGALSEHYVGKNMGEIWGYTTVGIIQTQEQFDNMPDQSALDNGYKVGDIQFADTNGDGVVNQGTNTIGNPGDRSIIGNTTPRYTFGLNTGANYKNFSLDVFFQGVGQRDYMPSNGDWTWFYPWRSYYGDKSWLTDSWTEDNRDAYFPAANIGGRNFKHAQTRFLQSAAYIRLKSLTIGYSLPKTLVSKVGLTNLRLYLGGQNLWEFSKMRKPLDPEYIFDSSIDYPLMRTFTFGLNVNL